MTRVSLVAASYVALVRGDEVLLQLRQGTGYMDDHWALGAAGHLEAKESVFGAAVREAREELSVEIAEADLNPFCTMHRIQGAVPIDQRVDFFFSCDRWLGTPSIVERNLVVELRWVALDALPYPMVPHEERALNLLRSGEPYSVLTHGFGSQ